MQLQFEKRGIPCLQTVKREAQSQEQTQELRISDGMPDIGSIIGAWGQVIVRSKEWLGDGMSVSGGTMIWVQYMPEEGGQPRCVESWLPFQMRWSFPQTQRDGSILTQCILRSVDARSTSARKMMLRANVSVLAWAVERQEKELFAPVDLPDDIQIKLQRYPMHLPAVIGPASLTPVNKNILFIHLGIMPYVLNIVIIFKKIEHLFNLCLYISGNCNGILRNHFDFGISKHITLLFKLVSYRRKICHRQGFITAVS